MWFWCEWSTLAIWTFLDNFISYSHINTLQFMGDTSQSWTLRHEGGLNSELSVFLPVFTQNSEVVFFPPFFAHYPASLGKVGRRCSDTLSCYPEPEMKVLRASNPFKTPPPTSHAVSHWSEKCLVAWYWSHTHAHAKRQCLRILSAPAFEILSH